MFSPNKFFTNYEALSREAKASLFGSDGVTRKSLDQIARIVGDLKSVSRFTNTSNTSPDLTMGALLVGSFMSPEALIKIGGSLLSANVMARLMSNKSFVQALAKSSSMKVSPNNVSRAMKSFGKVAEENPEIAEDVGKYIALISVVGSKQ